MSVATAGVLPDATAPAERAVTMGLLRTGSLRSFLDAASDPQGFCLFLHLPKTAGSSLAEEIATHLPPHGKISLDYLDGSLSHRLKRQAAVDGFLADLAGGGGLRSASGHITMGQALQIRRAHPSTRIVTFLRDPVSRVISDYRYQRTPAHPLHATFAQRFPTIEDYVRAEQGRNKMFKRLAIRPTGDVGAAIAEIERTVAFVGLLELYAMSVGVLFRLFGAEAVPTAYLRRTEDTGSNGVAVTPELAATILDLNRNDAALYDHFRALLAPHEAEWDSLRRSAPPI